LFNHGWLKDHGQIRDRSQSRLEENEPDLSIQRVSKLAGHGRNVVGMSHGGMDPKLEPSYWS
jgi:hypothetical protein